MSLEPRNSVTTRRRIVILLLIIFLVQTVIVARYGWVQIVWSPQLQKWAVDQWTNDTKIAAKRGKILDRNGNPLVVSGNVERVDAFLKDVNEAEKDKKITREQIAEKLAGVLNMSKEDILAKLNKRLPNGLPMSSITIARRIERTQGNTIREMKLPGIVITEDTKRYYPNGNFLAHVVGNTNIDGDGRSGIELQYNQELKGTPGRFMGETDAYHRDLPYSIATYVSPKNGNDLVLSIDQSIQYFTEKALEKGLVEFKAKQITAIVMDPKTGEILAMANKPDYDPNVPVKGSVQDSIKSWRNRAVNETFEPGSVLKVITSAASIEENVVSSSDRFVCNGSYKVADRTIHCWKRTGHGVQNFANIMQNSCNVGFMILGDRLGKNKLYKYFSSFGLGSKTGIDLPGEEKGILLPIERVGTVELATQAFGQGISVTPIQFITALAAVANDGKLIEPHIVKKVLYTDENGNTSVVKEVKPKVAKQAMSVEGAKKLREIMETVVSTGGASKAKVDGYRIGGKTGTAQKVVNGVYAAGKYISSFAAIAPVDDPRFVLFLSIDEPDPSNYYSGQTAAPLAKGLMEDIFRYLNIPQDVNAVKTIPEVVVPEVRGLSTTDAQSVLKSSKLDFETQGNGSIIYDVSPKPGITVKENTKIVLYMGVDKNPNTKVAVPDFYGKTKKQIDELAKSIGIKIIFEGDGIGASQDLEASTEVDKNTTVRVILEQPED